MRWLVRTLVGLLIVVTIGAAVFTFLAWRSEIAPIESADKPVFEPDLVRRGAGLAALGNCMECHTARGGAAYAGGRPIETPFGTIYGTNITPDPETGIGRWSEAAFIRAMRDGVDREGQHLYPAFPYHYFVKMQDADLRALYSFMMTREPVQAAAPKNDLPFPLQFRPLLVGWKFLFHRSDRFRPDPERNEKLNRGAYLVDTVGHCGACHTPINALGAPERNRYMHGGESEGWHAPALLASLSKARIPWTAESLFYYLKYGVDPQHAFAAGPMMPVVHSLQNAPEEDLHAIASYVGELMENRSATAEKAASRPAIGENPGGDQQSSSQTSYRDSQAPDAATIFVGACGICHADTGPLLFQATVPLDVSTTISMPDPRNAIQVILNGIHAPPPGASIMPGFAETLNDEQLAALLVYLRARFSREPAWQKLSEHVRNARQGQRP